MLNSDELNSLHVVVHQALGTGQIVDADNLFDLLSRLASEDKLHFWQWLNQTDMVAARRLERTRNRIFQRRPATRG